MIGLNSKYTVTVNCHALSGQAATCFTVNSCVAAVQETHKHEILGSHGDVNVGVGLADSINTVWSWWQIPILRMETVCSLKR